MRTIKADLVEGTDILGLFLRISEKEIGILDHLTCLLQNLYAGQKAIVRTRHGTTDWFQIGKEYIKAIYCHPAYLTYMQSTSCKMLGWMKLKLEKYQ